MKNIPWEDIRDNVVVLAAKEIRDSTNSFKYKVTNPPDKLLDETVTDHLRKFGK